MKHKLSFFILIVIVFLYQYSIPEVIPNTNVPQHASVDWNPIKTDYCIVIQTCNKTTLTEYDMFLQFLEQDNTNNNTYILTGKDMYICVNFATDLSQNLNDHGYVSGIVVRSAKWHNKGTGHLLTWVKIDNQLYVIESMNDYVWTSDIYNKSIDKNVYVTRYESLDSGYKKVNEMYKCR